MQCAQPLVTELAQAVRPEAPPSPVANTPDQHSPAAIAASPGWDFAEEEDEGWEAVGGGVSGAGVAQGAPAVGNSSGVAAVEAAGVRYTAVRRSEARDLATGAAEESLSSLRPGNMERHPFFKALNVLICLPEASSVRRRSIGRKGKRSAESTFLNPNASTQSFHIHLHVLGSTLGPVTLRCASASPASFASGSPGLQPYRKSPSAFACWPSRSTRTIRLYVPQG